MTDLSDSPVTLFRFV